MRRTATPLAACRPLAAVIMDGCVGLTSFTHGGGGEELHHAVAEGRPRDTSRWLPLRWKGEVGHDATVAGPGASSRVRRWPRDAGGRGALSRKGVRSSAQKSDVEMINDAIAERWACEDRPKARVF